MSLVLSLVIYSDLIDPAFLSVIQLTISKYGV